MILVDANILVYAHVESFAQHKPACDWLDQQLNGSSHRHRCLAIGGGVEFIDENGGGPGVRLRKRLQGK